MQKWDDAHDVCLSCVRKFPNIKHACDTECCNAYTACVGEGLECGGNPTEMDCYDTYKDDTDFTLSCSRVPVVG
jgi:hypothetical protein